MCLEYKPREEFYSHKETKDLLRSECKICWNKQSLKYHEENRENILKKQKEYHYKKNYNLSLQQVKDMLNVRNNCCDICKEECDLVVDHDHKTNKVRGLLCMKCNQGLGSFKDNIQTLNNAIEYLNKKEEK